MCARVLMRNMHWAKGYPPISMRWIMGSSRGFPSTNETSYSSDMFAEMRVAFYMQRALAQNRKFGGQQNVPTPVHIRDVLEAATVNGANCAGLADKVGSIAPRQEADLVLIRSDDINLYPSNNALGSVVQAAGPQQCRQP